MFLTTSYIFNTYSMVILASREHTCIHPNVSRSKKKNEDCKNLLDYKEVIYMIIDDNTLYSLVFRVSLVLSITKSNRN